MSNVGSVPTPYDVVPYPSRAQLRLHPERTATIARLLGVELADVAKSRVLELGCGDGVNLASMAVAFPESRFVGIDLASRPIESGRELVADAGLTNIELLVADLTALPPELGTFDYVIAHGVYSWVPPEVRDALLAACKRCLGPRGIAYVSYAVYPGCHVRELVRDMMLIHTDGIENPVDKVNEGRSFVRFIREHQTAGTGYGALLESELGRIESLSPEYLFHDDFSTENAPVYFGAFLHHARAHGLDFFSESQFASFSDPKIGEALKNAVSTLAAGDVATNEQYLDFLSCRAFRQTLLCHTGTDVERTLDFERVFALHASTPLKALSATPQFFDTTAEAFEVPHGEAMTTSTPILKVLLSLLTESWPRALPVAQLWRETEAALLAHGVPSQPEDRGIFSRCLLQSAAAGLLLLDVVPPKFAFHAGPRPVASPLVRAQARRGAEVTSLKHLHHRITDASTLFLLTLLDGTRTRPEILAAVREYVERTVQTEPKPEVSPERLEQTLETFARQALLVA